MLQRSDIAIINYLFNVRKHLDKDWDHFLVISGVTGAGKSIFMLNLIETWYKIIIEKDVNLDVMKNITGEIIEWCNNLIDLKDYDINIYDEGLLSMDTKDHMTKVQKEVKKIFNTVRSSKKLLNVIIVQDWFSLTKYFREHRASTLIHIDKRGHYKMFTKNGLKYLNGYNERRSVKSMTIAYPYHHSTFPDYHGLLRKPYYDYINQLKTEEIQKSINVIKGNNMKKVSVAESIEGDVKSLMKRGFNYKQIKEELGVSINNVCAAAQKIKKQEA